MKIVLCPDKFKGSISAEKICHVLSIGLMLGNPELDIISQPMADGGDGSIQLLQSLLKLSPITVKTVDPLGRNIEATYYHDETTAYIELASASGLVLLKKSERDPMKTSTLGTGVMMRDAFDRGFKTVNLFIGGSATNDGGTGIASALGFEFFNKLGRKLIPNGEELNKIDGINYTGSYKFENVIINVICDVTNPMHGPNGAAYVYAKQKGASLAEIKILDEGLQNYSRVLEKHSGKDISKIPGMGAAGAVAASLTTLMHAKIKNGFQVISEITHLEDAIKNADLIITGEGKIDSTSFQGKVVGNVLSLCKKYKKPCGIICGTSDISEELRSSFSYFNAIMSITENNDEAMTQPEKFLVKMGEEIGLGTLR